MKTSPKTIRVLPVARLQATPAHAQAFAALAHLSRLQVFFLLVQRGREVAAGEIQEALGIPGPTLTHHLAALRHAGLVTSRKHARFVYSAVRPDTVTDLIRLLSACC
jgi:DNA-binding transcriptional ArsR family regulator